MAAETPPDPRPVYVTTPIYYVNDRPHIGHVYTTTICDVYARFQRFVGRDVFFLTGTDEHGQKIERSAAAAGVDPQAFADRVAGEFRGAMETFLLTHDEFIRTTDDAHRRQVQRIVRALQDVGALYEGTFEGWYDEGQEEYYTETKAKELEYTSPVTRKPLVRATERNYFFRLSAFQERLEAHFAAHEDFVMPPARRNEVLGRLREGLQDMPVSRTNFSWGVPWPDDPEHVVYVWIDALSNYVTALGLFEGEEGERASDRAHYWPATYHVVGKEILWFHAVIWPAMLMALDLPLPKHVYAHSFWISEGEKMSKSMGNFIDLEQIRAYEAHYGLDAWRWYVTTHGPLGATDANFVALHFHEVYETDLVNSVGNCSSRVSAMIGKYFDGVVPPPGETAPGDHDWPALTAEAVEAAVEAMDRFELGRALEAGMSLIRRVDAYINETEPYKLARDPSRRDDVGAVLYRCAEAIRIASLLLWPACPQRIEALWAAFGCSVDPRSDRLADLARWGGLEPGRPIEKCALFPRTEPMESAERATT